MDSLGQSLYLLMGIIGSFESLSSSKIKWRNETCKIVFLFSAEWVTVLWQSVKATFLVILLGVEEIPNVFSEFGETRMKPQL